MALLVAFCVALPGTAEAATAKVKDIDSDYYGSAQTYKFDITNDGKKDKVKVSYASKAVKVSVNGESALSVKVPKAGLYIDLKLITLKNGKDFLYLHAAGYSKGDDSATTVEGVYCYVDGKLKACFTNNIAKNVQYTTIKKIKVSGNTVKATYYAQSQRVGEMKFTYSYKYKNGTLKRAATSDSFKAYSNTADKMTTGYFTTAHKIKAKASASSKAKTVTLAKNTKVKVTQVSVKDKTMWFKMTTKSGTTCWVKNIGSCGSDGTYDTCLQEGGHLAG